MSEQTIIPVADTRSTSQVVVAEADPTAQMRLVMAVQEAGADLRLGFVSTGDELLSELRSLAAGGERPTMVVLAVDPMRSGGLEMLELLRRNRTVCPPEIGIVGSWPRLTDIDQLLARGAAWVEPRPERFEDLVDLVRLIDDRCRLHRDR